MQKHFTVSVIQDGKFYFLIKHCEQRTNELRIAKSNYLPHAGTLNEKPKKMIQFFENVSTIKTQRVNIKLEIHNETK